MGAWGHGLLQCDETQDGLAHLIGSIEEDIARLAKSRPGEAAAARLGAAVGLLLQMQAWYSFNEENEASGVIRTALQRQQPHFAALPGKAGKLLQAVLDGKGEELAGRPGRLSAPLRRAFFATPVKDFPTERNFGKREPDLFRHPEAARYVQQVADRCVRMLREGFGDEEVVGDITREGSCLAGLALLLVMEPCQVDPRLFERWRDKLRRFYVEMAKERAAYAEEGDEDVEDPEDEFEKDFVKCLEVAWKEAAKKFGPTRAGRLPGRKGKLK